MGGSRKVACAGTINYIEGQASVNGQPVDSKSIGSEVVNPGAVLSTGDGKVEMLLTPGVFLRLGPNSQLRMISPDLANTEVALLSGQASIEADYFSKDNRLVVDQSIASTQILKKGLYLVNSNQPFVEVLDGKAKVFMDDQHATADKDRQVVVNASGKLKAQDLNEKAAKDEPLVRWSRLRSEYEAQANYDAARTVVVENNGWYGPGWYWDPGFGYWSFLPGAGMLYSPFGWGFYSPAFIYSAPVFYARPSYYGRSGYYARPGFAGHTYGYRAPATGGLSRGGFRSGGLSGGGFRGGGFARGGGVRR